MIRLDFCLEMRRKHPETPFIHSSVNVPEWVTLGKNVSIHEGCTIGTQGFGFERDENEIPLHIPHVGRLIIEDDVEIFEGTNVCRGTVGNTRIGKGTKIDALCHIGHNSVIGQNCILTAHCIVGGSAMIGDNVYIGLNATIRDHVVVAHYVFIGCGSNVIENINTPPLSVWAGNPAKFIRMKKWNEG